MTDSSVIDIAMQTMIVTAKVCGPILVVSLVVGLAVSLFQSVTQVQEMSLTFVPKLLGVAVVLLVSGTWMLGQLVAYTHQLFNMIPDLIRA